MTIYSLSSFQKIGAKPEGIEIGYLAQKVDDKSIWIMKIHSNIGYSVAEFIAGKLYNYYLPNQTPEIILIDKYKPSVDGLMVKGSRLLNSYKNLAEYSDNELKSIPEGFIVDKEKVLLISKFFLEDDMRKTNIGLIKNGSYYHFARIDFDKSLIYSYGSNLISKDLLTARTMFHFDVDNKEICLAAKYILETPFNILGGIIDSACKELESYNDINFIKSAYRDISYAYRKPQDSDQALNEFIKNKLFERYESLKGAYIEECDPGYLEPEYDDQGSNGFIRSYLFQGYKYLQELVIGVYNSSINEEF